MKRNNIFIGSGQEHLSLAVLRRYQEGTLPALAEHRVEKHVLGCALCADILAGMELQSARQTAEAVGDLHRRLAVARARHAGRTIPLFSRRNLAVAASLLLLLCAAGVVFFYNLEQVKQKAASPVATTPSGPARSPAPVLRPAPSPGRQPAPVPVRPAPANPPPEELLATATPAVKPAAPSQAGAPPPAPTAAGEAAAKEATVSPPLSSVPIEITDSAFTQAAPVAAAPAPATVSKATVGGATVGYSRAARSRPAERAAADVAPEVNAKALNEVVIVDYGDQNNTVGELKVTAGASPAGGWNNYKQYLQAHLKQPAEAAGPQAAGRVEVGFTVQADGRLTEVRVLKSLSPAADAEALRLVQQGPGWQPAKAGDQPVAQPVRIAIRFRGQE